MNRVGFERVSEVAVGDDTFKARRQEEIFTALALVIACRTNIGYWPLPGIDKRSEETRLVSDINALGTDWGD